ncbi:MAG: SPASM domain-containing protein [Deltaproteobacteria bacterium]|nr:SPASM domain-containing protein [Deltaproteobacteria bacterium]
MHPHIMKVIELIKKRGMVCHINTNFTLVTKERAKGLIDAEADQIIVSLWAATPDTYVRCHPNKTGDTFYQMIDVLHYLIGEKKDKPHVKLYNVMFTHNYHEFDDMLRLALDLLVDAAEFTVVDTIPGKTDSLLLSEGMKKFILSRIARLKKNVPYDYEWHEGNYIFHFDDGMSLKLFKFEHFIRRLLNQDCVVGDYDSNIIQKMPCYIGWIFARILSNGDVNACLKAHKIPVGNINRNSFREIWNGDKQREFRKHALRIEKDESFFSMIGNDPHARVGCLKSCDDITRNVIWHHRIEALNPSQREMLEGVPGKYNLAPC